MNISEVNAFVVAFIVAARLEGWLRSAMVDRGTLTQVGMHLCKTGTGSGQKFINFFVNVGPTKESV